MMRVAVKYCSDGNATMVFGVVSQQNNLNEGQLESIFVVDLEAMISRLAGCCVRLVGPNGFRVMTVI